MLYDVSIYQWLNKSDNVIREAEDKLKDVENQLSTILDKQMNNQLTNKELILRAKRIRAKTDATIHQLNAYTKFVNSFIKSLEEKEG